MLHTPTTLLSAWGAWAVFVSVLATQLGVPVPSAPMLILAGSLAASGMVSLPHVIAAAITAVLIADCLWFCVGRLYGRRFLNMLVRFSLTFDMTLRTAHSWLERYGAPLVAISKFVPGLGLVSPPLIGTTQVRVWNFIAWDLLGAVLWSCFWIFCGAALHADITWMLGYLARHGQSALDAVAFCAVGVAVYRWIRRLCFRRWLAKIRITAEELDAKLRSDAPPVVFDARPAAVRRDEPYRIIGALPLDLESSDKIGPQFAERELVVYCVCPNEATAKQLTRQLRRKGFRQVRPLKGGLDTWARLGYPVEPIPPGHVPERDEGANEFVGQRAA